MTTPGAISPEDLESVITRGVSEIISREEFVRLLQSGKQLRLKMGFDPSRPDIHLGHVVGLRKLRQLQELGHQVILIVGDWTAQIGDPSGQSATRTMLSHAQVLENAQSYLRQFFKVVDQTRAQVIYQSEWFGKFDLAKVIELTGRFTVAQFLQRADFAQRFADQKPIAITELLYPLLQAYDSVEIKSDVEFGGTDQMFNLLVGRELQGMMGQTPQQCFMMPILVGTDGVMKMSKSLDNYVAVDEPPENMYGKLMSVSDEQIISYMEYLTDFPMAEITTLAGDFKKGLNPMETKKRLAWDVTRQFHDKEAANAAQAHFERVIQGRDLPEDIPQFNFRAYRAQGLLFGPPEVVEGEASLSPGNMLLQMLVASGLAKSNREAKTLLDQGGIELIKPDGGSTKLTVQSTVSDLNRGDVIRRGKRRFVRLTDS
ncbi:MAG: tyrosine--tRNA ligase [Chloroflexi bacterium]|nr:tyrosine--tRNA ligase [Chloroflexota bacterium]MDA1271346.1 tyrosine--tRNA ligase [Chloroflexota bacterium]PKB59344.1 MAG: tyrosine--tRNA ligase [SAR202 cluster bacterium Casp-Chloro-G2]